MFLLNWNICFQSLASNFENIIESIKYATPNHAAPDIVALQEVKNTLAPQVVEGLRNIGLVHVCDSRDGIPADQERNKPYHCLIASRWKVKAHKNNWRDNAPLQELLGRATVQTPDGNVDIFTVHIPNGSGNGWAKIDTYKVLSATLRKADDAPRILTGDFNEPREFRRSGQIVTFGENLHQGGGLSIPELKNKRHEKRPGVEWTYEVLAVLAGSTQHGLQDAYRTLYGYKTTPITHFTAQKNPRCFDHMFVSRHFEVLSCGYFHEWRESKLSDHSPMWAKLRLQADQPPLTNWETE